VDGATAVGGDASCVIVVASRNKKTMPRIGMARRWQVLADDLPRFSCYGPQAASSNRPGTAVPPRLVVVAKL
jgi:hypothetical protein